MGSYIRCPKCLDDSFDVDTFDCDCGFAPVKRITELEEENKRLRSILQEIADMAWANYSVKESDQ